MARGAAGGTHGDPPAGEDQAGDMPTWIWKIFIGHRKLGHLLCENHIYMIQKSKYI